MEAKLFSEAELKDLLLQVSMGLKYVHSLGLVHLDIKPSNSARFSFCQTVLFIVRLFKVSSRFGSLQVIYSFANAPARMPQVTQTVRRRRTEALQQESSTKLV